MPRVNIYLSVEDYAKWGKLVNKSAFVSAALRDLKTEHCKHGNPVGYCSRGCGLELPNETAKEAPKKSPGLCEHGQKKKECLFPKCAFSRYK